MPGNKKNTFSLSQKKAAVEKLKKDFSTASFKKIAAEVGCSLITIRNWAERHGSYVRRTQKPSNPKAPHKEQELLLDVNTVNAMSKELKKLEPLMKKIKAVELEIEELQVTVDGYKKEYLMKQSEIKKSLGL